MALVNRDGAGIRTIAARWSWLEAPEVNDSTSFCVVELFSGRKLGTNVGGVSMAVAPFDIAMLRLIPGAAC
jgi:hypothetical protein